MAPKSREEYILVQLHGVCSNKKHRIHLENSIFQRKKLTWYDQCMYLYICIMYRNEKDPLWSSTLPKICITSKKLQMKVSCSELNYAEKSPHERVCLSLPGVELGELPTFLYIIRLRQYWFLEHPSSAPGGDKTYVLEDFFFTKFDFEQLLFEAFFGIMRIFGSSLVYRYSAIATRVFLPWKIPTFPLIHFHLRHSVNQTVIKILWPLFLPLLTMLFFMQNRERKICLLLTLMHPLCSAISTYSKLWTKNILFTHEASSIHFHSISLLFWFNICFNFNQITVAVIEEKYRKQF